MTIATAVLVVVQLPLMMLALVRRGARDPHIVPAACLTVGTALVNAVLYALGNGLQNVRYALPGYVLVYAVIVWANLAVLATAWYASAPFATGPRAGSGACFLRVPAPAGNGPPPPRRPHGRGAPRDAALFARRVSPDGRIRLSGAPIASTKYAAFYLQV
jgi:hypothetical protein